MAGRSAARCFLRRFSSGGKVLSEEEKAAENVYIKKMEKEKLEKLARQGVKPETQASGSVSGAPVTEGVKPTEAPKVSEDKFKNYAIVAGTITALAAAGWWYKSRSKKTEEVHD
ncbi:unnamed protein product [Amaranthus hypochondriacus]